MKPEDKTPGAGNPEGQNEPNADPQDSASDTPMFDGMTSGKVRPAPREPNTTWYRDRNKGGAR